MQFLVHSFGATLRLGRQPARIVSLADLIEYAALRGRCHLERERLEARR
jgi:hypothetical protein